MSPYSNQLRRSRRGPRRGMSLVIVLAVVGVASVMGMAILSGAALQAEAAATRAQGLQADALAESGLNLGAYYLQNMHDPTKAPAGVGGTKYKATGIGLGGDGGGTVDLTITRVTPTRFTVSATGNATSTRGTVARTLTTTVDVGYVEHGLYLSSGAGSTTIPPSVTVIGDAYAAGPVVNNGTVTGTLYSDAASGGGTGLVKGLLDTVQTVLPATVYHYNPVYLYYKDNKPYTAGTILLGSLSNTALGPTVLNPAGVYVRIGHLDLNGGVTVNGTLIVTGQLRVQGVGNVITAAAQFPAAVVDQDVNFKTDGARLDAHGLMWVGGKVVKSSGSVTAAVLNVTGALLMPGGVADLFDPAVIVTLRFDRARAAVPSLSGAAKPVPTSVKIVDWKVVESKS